MAGIGCYWLAGWVAGSRLALVVAVEMLSWWCCWRWLSVVGWDSFVVTLPVLQLFPHLSDCFQFVPVVGVDVAHYILCDVLLWGDM